MVRLIVKKSITKIQANLCFLLFSFLAAPLDFYNFFHTAQDHAF